MGVIFNIACIASGILLGIETLDKWDGDKDFFVKAEKFLLPYNTSIGGTLLILSALNLLKGNCLIYNILAIAGGLLLLTNILSKTPAIGDLLIKASKALLPFKAIIGIAIIVVGATGILGIKLLC